MRIVGVLALVIVAIGLMAWRPDAGPSRHMAAVAAGALAGLAIVLAKSGFAARRRPTGFPGS